QSPAADTSKMVVVAVRARNMTVQSRCPTKESPDTRTPPCLGPGRGSPFIDYMHIDDEPTGAAEAQSTTFADRGQMVRRSSAAVATSREGHHSPFSLHTACSPHSKDDHSKCEVVHTWQP